LFEEASEALEMGLPAAAVEYESTHSGGAKSNRWDTDASRDDRCRPFGIEPRLWARSMITVRATPIERLFDGVGFGFGKQTLRCRIAP
jgi:hypothetical protein